MPTKEGDLWVLEGCQQNSFADEVMICYILGFVRDVLFILGM
jgi:hypothetical protein